MWVGGAYDFQFGKFYMSYCETGDVSYNELFSDLASNSNNWSWESVSTAYTTKD